MNAQQKREELWLSCLVAGMTKRVAYVYEIMLNSSISALRKALARKIGGVCDANDFGAWLSSDDAVVSSLEIETILGDVTSSKGGVFHRRLVVRAPCATAQHSCAAV